MWRWLKRLPGFFIRSAAFIGIIGMALAVLATRIPPQEQVWLAFFGLSYPVWLALAILGMFYSVARKRWWLFGVLAAVLVLTASYNLATFGMGSGDRPDAEQSGAYQTLRVMSYNVRLFDLYNWGGGKNTRNEIFDFLEAHPVDVLCFQEFYHTDNKGAFDTRDTMLTFLENKYVHERYTHEMTGEQYFGVVTMSRFPIINRGEIAFSSDANNFCIYSDIVVASDTFRVYNTHLASIRFQPEDYTAIDRGPDRKEAERLLWRLAKAFRKRGEQIDTIAGELEKSPYPSILCGDFNDTPVSYAYGRMSAHMTDAFVGNHTGFGGTHIGLFPFLRIDYVWTSEQFQTVYFKLHEQIELSDHHPIEVHLNW